MASSELTLVGADSSQSFPGSPGHPTARDLRLQRPIPRPQRLNGVVDERNVRLTFTFGPVSCSETIDLTRAPNPYMLDVDPAGNNPHWLQHRRARLPDGSAGSHTSAT